MFSRRTAPLLLTILVIVPTAAAQDGHLWVGPNVNMVSGTTFPDGDPFLQRQNEPSVAVSTRDTMTLMGFANDYRAVDLPGLQPGKETGDAWLGVFKSFDGGQTWQSTLLPGYPQDFSQEGLDSPLSGYQAAADPVVRAGTHGLFYLSGIVFDRGDPARSALFVARYVDLNNLESGDTIEYIDTGFVKENAAGEAFIDKPWMAVDIPRSAAPAVAMSVNQSEKALSQSVECGNVYLAWAEVEGVAPNQWSTIYLSRSTDCGESWESPIAVNDVGTMAQGVTVAVSPSSGDVWVAWRQFDTETVTTICISESGYWKDHPEEWPLESMVLGDQLYSKDEAYAILNSSKGGHTSYILAHQLIPAKLNVGYSMVGGEIQELIAAADAWLVDHPFLGDKPQGVDKDEGLALKDQLEAFNSTPMEGDECPSVPGPDDTIMAAHLSYGGQSLTSPVMVSALHPFEQGTTEYSFRTNAYPTMTVDDSGRAYLAWTTRGLATPRIDTIAGDARIVVSTSTDADPSSWTSPQPIDQPNVPGHQFDPSITFAGGKVVLVYYDLRQDVSGIFDRFIADFPAITPILRHTVDVRAAQADPDAVPVFTSYGVAPERPSSQVSRYVFMAQYPGTGDPPVPEYSDTPEYLQLQYNPPGLPIYLEGLKPFFGDYLDVGASPPFVPDGDGWRFNTTVEDGATFHAVWTDNRDVEAPYDGNWSNYVVPGDEHESFYDPNETVPACDQENSEGQTRIRNQNIYTARLSSGLSVGSAGASRPVDALQRAFVVNVRNDSEETKQFELSFAPTTGVTVSFEQFGDPTDTLSVWVAPFSSASRTVFVTAAGGMDDPQPVRVVVEEVGGDGLASSILLNPDPTNPPPADSSLLTVEQYNPAMMNRTLTTPAMMNLAMMNPAMMNLAMMNLAMMNPAMMNLAMMNPAMMNLAMMNLAMMNPAMMNLAMMNPAMMNPAMMNLAMMNLAMMNPAMMNLAMMNPAMMNLAMMNAPPDEITWEMTNEGNASAAFSFNLLGENPPEPCEPCSEGTCDPEPCFVFQLFIYREYKTPAADGCELIEATQQQMLVNVVDPDFLDPTDQDQLNEFFRDPWRITDQGLDNPTFTLEPGDTVYATLWIYDFGQELTKSTRFGEQNVWASIVAQPVNTDDVAAGKTEPSFDSDLLIITTTSLPVATAGVNYSQTLTATTGLGEHSWVLASGSDPLPGSLTLDNDGLLSGTVPAIGSYQFIVQVSDTYEVDQMTLTLTVTEASVAFVNEPINTPIGGFMESPVQVLVDDGSGDGLAGFEVTIELDTSPPGASANLNHATTDSEGIATFDDLWFDRLGGVTLVATVALEDGVSFTSDPSSEFNVVNLVVTNTDDDGPGSLRRAIENAERNVNYQDTISFDIGGALPHVISVLSPLPPIWDSVRIDATTEPDYTASPVVHLNGAKAGLNARGLMLRAANSDIFGLAIVNFSSTGIFIENEPGIRIQYNFVGTNGADDLGNAIGITANNCSGLIVARNVISGNDGPGMRLGEAVTGAIIAENKIGTNAAGDSAIGNSAMGIWLFQPDSFGNTIVNNVISGNNLDGLQLWNGTHDNIIVGNRIGTGEMGEIAVPNANGISIVGSDQNRVGGALDGEGNLISGNLNNGIDVRDSDSTYIFGNFVGTNEGGSAAIGNGNVGIQIWQESRGNEIGGSGDGEENLISGNSWGVYIQAPATQNFVEGNLIGTDSTGAAALGNGAYGLYLRAASNTVLGNVVGGNTIGIQLSIEAASNRVAGNYVGIDRTETTTIGNVQDGIAIESGAASNIIGGTNPGDANIIATNGWRGVFIQNANDNWIVGNFIGTNRGLSGAIGNSGAGISVLGSDGTLIGGVAPGAANTIAYNSDGVVIWSGAGNEIGPNSIFDNIGLGIDLSADGVTLNDTGDGDSGPNDLLNYPVLTSAIDNGASTEVIGSVDVGVAGTPLTLRFFASPTCDASGNGEGQTYLNDFSLTAGPDGTRSFTATLPTGLVGQQITATSSTPAGTGSNTSEFSACVAVVSAPLSVTTSALPYGLAGTSYTETLLATEGFGPLAWSLAPTSPALPGTLTVTPVGNITGILPLAFGSYPMTVHVTDGTQSATKDLTLTVNHPNITFDTHPISAVSGGNLGPVTVTFTFGGSPLAGVTLEIALLGPSPCSASSLTGGGPSLAPTDSNGKATWSGLSVSGGGWGYNLVVFNPLEIGMASASAPFDVEGFCPTGSMSMARGIHSATLLPSGNVLVAGGWNLGVSLDSAEIYNPDDRTFSMTGSMHTARANFPAVELSEGRVFVAPIGGGLGEIYDEGSGAFSLTTGVGAALQSDSTATLLPNDKVLILGTYELFDALDESFTLSGAFSANRRVRAHTSTLLPNGNVLIAGGIVTPTGDARIGELYNYGTDSITFSTTTMTSARRYHTASLLPDGKVLLAGGNEGAASLPGAELYDPLTDSAAAAGSLNRARESHAAVSLPNGEVLVIGGHDSTIGADLSSAEIYDPLDNAFTYTDSLATSRFPAIATMLNDGSVLVTGDALTNTAEIFYPIGGWTYQEAEWSRQVATDDWDVIWASDADAGNVYVVGDTQGTFPGMPTIPLMDAFVRSYDSNGIERWTDQIGSDGVDRGQAVDASTAGIAVTGGVGSNHILPGQISAGEEDGFVRLYTAAGGVTWTRQFGTADWENAEGVTVDSTGVYVVGETEGAFAGYTNSAGSDAYVRKYNLAGTHLWTRQFGGAVFDTIGKFVDRDLTGVYVAGETQETLPGQLPAVDQEAFVRKYDFDGNELWTRQFGMSTGRGEYVWDLAVHSTGIYVGGTTKGAFPGHSNPGNLMQAFLRKYDASGTEIWTLQFGGTDWCDIRGISVDETGVYVSGGFEGSLPGFPALGDTLANAFIRKFDFDGNLIWTRVLTGYDDDYAVGGVATDSSGVYVPVFSNGALPGHTSKGFTDSYLFKMQK